MNKIAVLGAGHGGHAMAADLSLRGNQVTLYERPSFAHNIQKVLRTGTIKVTGSLPLTGTANLELVTTDIKEALKDAEFIFLPVPSFALNIGA